MDARNSKDLVMPAAEARLLRDEIVKLLADRVEDAEQRGSATTGSLTEDIVISGGRW